MRLRIFVLGIIITPVIVLYAIAGEELGYDWRYEWGFDGGRVRVHDAIAHIADAQLADCMTQKSGHLKYADRVNGIYCVNKGIRSLEGIEHFPNLWTIIAGDNLIEQVDLSKNPQLDSIVLVSNQLKQIDLSHNPNLRQALLGNNQISEVKLKRNLALRQVRLNQNRLQSFDLTQAPGLSSVDLSNNQLTQVTFPDHLGLISLSLEHNQLSHLDFTKLSSAVAISMHHNQFESIPETFDVLVDKYKPFDLRDNPLDETTKARLKALKASTGDCNLLLEDDPQV